MGLALSVGMIALADISRLQKLAFDRQPHVARLTHWGFAIMFVTGPAMFLADRTRYLSNPAFLCKISLLAMALVMHLTVRARWRTRTAAALSLLLWTGVVLAARAIADFDV